MDREGMRHINIYNTTEEYNAAKSELYTLEHFVAYNKETNEILTKDIVNITFNITPEDATINYSIDNESYDQVASNGVPIQVTYKSTLYYRISKSGYSNISGMFFANSDSTITYTLNKEANIGDVIIYKDGEFFAVNPNELTNEGTPIGIVAIPSSHNIYGDGSCGVMGLNIGYHRYGDEIEYPLNNYQTIVTIGKDIPTDSIKGTHYLGYLPSDIIQDEYIGVTSLDTITNYTSTPINISGDDSRMAPSPYGQNGDKNLLYCSPYSQYNNAFSDFDGKENTRKLVEYELGGTKDAANYCYTYSTDGTNPGDWYFLTLGELGYVYNRLQTIMLSIQKINSVFSTSYNIPLENDRIYYIASTQYNDAYNWYICFNVEDTSYGTNDDSRGYVDGQAFYKTEQGYTIPFLKLKL